MTVPFLKKEETLEVRKNENENLQELLQKCRYSITCIQRPLKGSNESGLSQKVVFK